MWWISNSTPWVDLVECYLLLRINFWYSAWYHIHISVYSDSHIHHAHTTYIFFIHSLYPFFPQFPCIHYTYKYLTNYKISTRSAKTQVRIPKQSRPNSKQLGFIELTRWPSDTRCPLRYSKSSCTRLRDLQKTVKSTLLKDLEIWFTC